VRNWRVFTAVAAVVLAALAVVLVRKYTQNQRNEAKKPYTLVSVLVAGKGIPANTSYASALKAGQIAKVQFLKKNVPDSAIPATDANVDPAKTPYKNLVASHDIANGVPLTSDDFVSQGQVASGLAGQLQTDQTTDKQRNYEAVTLSVDDTHAVAGMLHPGDSVNALFTGVLTDPTNPNGKGVRTTAFLLPGLKIISVGSQTLAPQTVSETTPTTTNTNTNTSRSLITFEANPRQAEQLIQASQIGSVYLTLNPTSFNKSQFQTPVEVVEAVNLFDQPLTEVQSVLAQIKNNTH